MPRKYTKKGVDKQYLDSDLKLAIETVLDGCSIREASKRFRIPYTTLNSHVNGNVHHIQVGRPPKFNDTEEECLEKAALVLQVNMNYVFYSIFKFFISDMGFSFINQ